MSLNNKYIGADGKLEWEEQDSKRWSASSLNWEYRIERNDTTKDIFDVFRFANIENNEDDPELAIKALYTQASTLREAKEIASKWHKERYNDSESVFKAATEAFKKRMAVKPLTETTEGEE